MDDKNNLDLPDGFVPIEAPPRIILHFNPNYRRLYVSDYADQLGLLKFGSRVGLAYNLQTDELLIDKQGSSFNLTKDGYIMTKDLYDFLYRRCIVLDKELIHFELDYTKDTDRFLFFKMIDKSPDFS